MVMIGWMNGSFTLLVGRSRLGPVMIVHGVAITISSYLLGRLYDRTQRKNLLVWFTLAAFLLSLALTYWAIELECNRSFLQSDDVVHLSITSQ
jgi:predicted MFS family arabinose efflux permease